MIANRACARFGVDLRVHGVADLQSTARERTVVAEHVGDDFERIFDSKRRTARRNDAAVADLAAAFGVERRVVEHDNAVVARRERLHRRAALVERDDFARVRELVVAVEYSFFAAVRESVYGLEFARCARRGALLFHRSVETCFVDGDATLAADVRR